MHRRTSATKTKPNVEFLMFPILFGTICILPATRLGCSALAISSFSLGLISPDAYEEVADQRRPAAFEDVLYDSLCIRDGCNEEFVFPPNTCGGEAVFGRAYDVQAADDILTSQGYFVVSVTADYVVELGVCPESVCLGFFAESDEGCGPTGRVLRNKGYHRAYRLRKLRSEIQWQ